MSSMKKTRPKLKPLKISCTSADCDNGLHCFKKSQDMAKEDQGKCRYCEADLVEWDRVHKRSLDDVKFTFSSLKYEKVRHDYWHKDIDLQAQNHVRRKGREGIRERARIEIKKKVGSPENYREGYQTPWEGNIIYYAQHATACCCRSCIEYWHGIPKGVDLTDEQLDYFVELVMLYINDRMPDLTENGERVAPIKNGKSEDVG